MLNFFNWRARLVRDLTGNILEIGVGTGENFPFYRAATHVFGIEPDVERAAEARREAQEAAVPITVDVAPAEALPYADHRFDHVVSSLVFCSVADQRLALAEIARVLKPGGTLHMVEHVRPHTPPLAWLFDRLTPWWSRVENNCHLNRRTVETLRSAGWQVAVHRRIAMVVRMSAQLGTA